MLELEQTITSIEVASMVEKEHKFLMRDIRRYLSQIAEGNERYGGGCKVAPSDFFTKSTYRSEQNKEIPCYRITKKGCEFIAHKLTGTKGTIFTARYINKFHEMETALATVGSAEELARLRTAMEAQGKMLNSINRKLSNPWMGERCGGTMQDMYRNEIMRMITFMNDVDALCKVYTFAKYVPQRK